MIFPVPTRQTGRGGPPPARSGGTWPAFPLLGWGIGLAFNVWEVVSPQPTEDRIRAEMERIARRG